jgi:hypothetical protein
MGGGHKNFEDRMNIELLNYENQIFKILKFALPPFTLIVNPFIKGPTQLLTFNVQFSIVLGA